MSDSPFVTVSEMAAELRVHGETVRRLIRSGLLPSQRIGIGKRSIRVLREDFEAYLEATKTFQPAPRRNPKRVMA